MMLTPGLNLDRSDTTRYPRFWLTGASYAADVTDRHAQCACEADRLAASWRHRGCRAAGRTSWPDQQP